MKRLNRRQFIQRTTASIAAGALCTSGLSTSVLSQTSTKPLGIALLGLGYYSRDLLAPALQLTNHCKLTGIITGSPEKIPSWQKKYGIADKNVYQYATMQEIANNPDIDVIYVVTPTATHKDFCLAAANAGKHVWCEKPMAMTVSECLEIDNACKRNKVSLSLGYRMMHEPNTRTLAAYAKSSPFGSIKGMISEAGYAGNGLPQENWRMQRSMGGGALYDMGVYTINGVRFLSKMEPVAVTAYHEMTHPKFINTDDTTVMTLEFANQIQAKCRTSVVKQFNQLKIDCDKGWYQLQPMQSYSGVKGRDSSGVFLPAFSGNQQANQMDNDALAILGKGPFITRAEDGIRDIHIIEKVLEAANKGKRVMV